jgi:hypothetical protein
MRSAAIAEADRDNQSYLTAAASQMPHKVKHFAVI